MKRPIFISILSTFFVLFSWCCVLAEQTEPPSEASKRGMVSHTMQDVVVTATRTEMLREEVPSVINVIDSFALETTAADDLPGILKRNSSVDVIEYPGVLSGISIRGFRPEFSGIGKRYLVLIDGRPSGATNLSTILKGNVERIEVLKGPASALYGAEAMGGVVNVITKKSTGKVQTELEVGGGSFLTHTESIRSGGQITDRFDFDLSFSNKSQIDDLRMGNGETRANTSYSQRHGSLRLGSSFMDNWRLDAKGDWYAGRDIHTPNALFYGDTQPSSKDIDRYGGDVSLSGEWGNNLTQVGIFASREESEFTSRNLGEPAYKRSSQQYDWLGGNIQNTYSLWDRHDLTAGFDYQKIQVKTLRWLQNGNPAAPTRPNNDRENYAFFADGFFRFWNERLILNAGVRYDHFKLTTKETPLLTSFTPGSSDFDRVNPRAGIRYFLTEDRLFQLHGTVGTAFVPPESYEMAGYSESVVQGVTMITRGNPDLGPESSFTWDVGLTFDKKDYGLRADLTYFNTRVDDKIARQNLTPTLITYVNADSARMNGLEMELSWDLGAVMNWDRKVEFFANATKFFQAEEKTDGVTRDIYNVSHWKHSLGVNYDDGMIFGRFLARYMGERKDNDWYTPGYPEITYPSFTVCDLSMGVRFLDHHTVTLNVDNIFDKYYYEKPEYPLPGRAFFVKYTLNF